MMGYTAAAGDAYLSREDVRDPPQLPRDLVQAFHAHIGVRPRHRRVVNLSRVQNACAIGAKHRGTWGGVSDWMGA